MEHLQGLEHQAGRSGTAYADGATVKLKGNITLYAQWYVNVIIMAYRRQVKWTGKPQSVKGYSVILESNTDYVVKDAVFPGVTASCTATDIGIYPVEVKGAIVNKTTDRDGVYIVTGIRDGTLMILKPDATFTVKPRAKKLTYNGKYQALVEPGSSNDGLILYSRDRDNWSKEIPTAKNAGTYTVWYRVLGNARYDGSDAYAIKVTIAKKKLTVTADWQGRRSVIRIRS